MKITLIFSLVAAISFLGSVHPGPVNLSVLHLSLTRNFKSAVLLALGGSLPEMFYASLALFGVNYLSENQTIFFWLKILMLPILIIFGLKLILKKNNQVKLVEKPIPNSRFSFFRGMVLSLLNPQMLPFWAGVAVYFQANEMLKITNFSEQIAFILATSVGAFVLLFFYAKIATAQKTSISRYFNAQKIDFLTGFSFLGMAFYQIVTI